MSRNALKPEILYHLSFTKTMRIAVGKMRVVFARSCLLAVLYETQRRVVSNQVSAWLAFMFPMAVPRHYLIVRLTCTRSSRRLIYNPEVTLDNAHLLICQYG